MTLDPSTRTLNMRRRRDRILDHARRLIGRQGYDALTLRELAQAAEVTVPTIYNLVGNKAQLLGELNREMLDRLEAALDRRRFDDALDMAEAVIAESIALFDSDPDFYLSLIHI